LHPLNLKDLDDAKTMTDKFAAVCILQVRTPKYQGDFALLLQISCFSTLRDRWYIVYSVKVI
jgi:hypothetical protein